MHFPLHAEAQRYNKALISFLHFRPAFLYFKRCPETDR